MAWLLKMFQKHMDEIGDDNCSISCFVQKHDDDDAYHNAHKEKSECIGHKTRYYCSQVLKITGKIGWLWLQSVIHTMLRFKLRVNHPTLTPPHVHIQIYTHTRVHTQWRTRNTQHTRTHARTHTHTYKHADIDESYN